MVTPGYFDTLGVNLARGRMFSEDEAHASELTSVISYRIWTEHFQQRDDVIGERFVLNGQPATIVGVAPARFQGLWLGERSDVWVPLVAYARGRGQSRLLEDRTGGPFAMIGRLAPGVSLREAQSELSTIAARLQTAYPDANKRKAIAVFPYSATAAGDSMIAQRGPQFLALFSVITVLTLLIVCANVANLMLARAVARQREMAVRRSFGASQLRVIRLVLAEGIAISGAAWAVACVPRVDPVDRDGALGPAERRRRSIRRRLYARLESRRLCDGARGRRHGRLHDRTRGARVAAGCASVPQSW